MVTELRARGRGKRESGAFLLGENDGDRAVVRSVAYYDDLEPACLVRGVVNFTADGYRELWKVLKSGHIEVVADIHTHPADAFFSGTDRQHPMMPTIGHRAVVVPNYAQGNVTPRDVGFYRYLGSYEWQEFEPGIATSKLYVGWWI